MIDTFFVFFVSMFFGTVKVFGYVQAPMAYMNSMFQEKVKNGSADFANLHLLYPHYRERFEKLDQVFDKENVHLYPLTGEELHSGDVTLDFLERNHLKVKRNQFGPVHDSLSLEAVSFLYIFHKYGPGYGRSENMKYQNNALLEYMKSFGAEKFKLSMNVFNPLLETYQEDLLWIEERLDRPLLDEVATIFEQVDEVRCENDLLDAAKNNLEQLKKFVDKRVSVERITGNTLDDIIMLMQRLWLYTETGMA